MWLDESGSRQTARDCFVVAGIKTRQADRLLRDLHTIREGYQEHKHELKFGRISEGSHRIYLEAIDLLADHNVRLMASVVNGAVYNPFKQTSEPWRVHAHVIARLVQGNTNRNEVVSVLIDGITTPRDVALGQIVKRIVNGRIGSTVVIDAVTLNSKSNDLLQLADMVAGAIYYQRLNGHQGGTDPLKIKVAQRLAWAFDQPDLRSDVRTKKLNISTLTESRDPRWARKGNGRLGT